MHAPWRESRRRPTPLSWKLNPVPLVLNLESWAQHTRTLALTDTTTVPMFLILILLRSSRCARTANFTRTYLYDEQRDVTNVALRGLSWRARRAVTWRFFDVHDVTRRGCLRRGGVSKQRIDSITCVANGLRVPVQRTSLHAQQLHVQRSSRGSSPGNHVASSS